MFRFDKLFWQVVSSCVRCNFESQNPVVSQVFFLELKKDFFLGFSAMRLDEIG